MGNSQAKLKRKFNKLKTVIRTIKIIVVALDLNVVSALINNAPNEVIGAITDDTLNCRQSTKHIPLNLILFLSAITTNYTI